MALSSSTPNIAASSPNLFTKEIQDLYTRKNFQSLVQFFSSNSQLLGFNFFEIDVDKTTPTTLLNHNLGYVPKDVIVTQVTGPGTVQFLYGSFDATSISYLTTGACRVRFFVGTYSQDTSRVTAASTDIQTVVATPLVSQQAGVVTSNGPYTILGTEGLIQMSAAALAGSIAYLPAATNGASVQLQKVDANTNPVSLQVPANSPAKIYPSGLTYLTLTTQWKTVQLISDGTNWFVTHSWSGTV